MRGGYNNVNKLRQFQAQNWQHKNSNISEIVNPMESKFEDWLWDPHLHFVGGLHSAITLEKIQYFRNRKK